MKHRNKGNNYKYKTQNTKEIGTNIINMNNHFTKYLYIGISINP